jgi:hypothetical protein
LFLLFWNITEWAAVIMDIINEDGLIYPYYADDDLCNIYEWFKSSINSSAFLNIIFEFKEEDITIFKKQIEEMEKSLEDFPEDLERVEKIIVLIKNGEPIYAIFVDNDSDFILEGRHRIVAFNRYSLEKIPVYRVSKNKRVTIT